VRIVRQGLRHLKFSYVLLEKLGSIRGGPRSIPGQSLRGLWCTKWHLDKFSSQYVGFFPHPVNIFPSVLLSFSSEVTLNRGTDGPSLETVQQELYCY